MLLQKQVSRCSTLTSYQTEAGTEAFKLQEIHSTKGAQDPGKLFAALEAFSCKKMQ